mgnify:CR=1 FL=1
MKSRVKKLLSAATISGIILCTVCGIIYKWGLPAIVNSHAAANFIEAQAKKSLNADFKIQGMKLRTGGTIAFTVDKFTIDKNGVNYLTLSDIDTLFSLRELHKKNIIVRKMLAKNIYIDAYNLSQLFPQQKKKKKEKKEAPIHLDFYNTLLGVKNVTLVYHAPNLALDLQTKHAIFDRRNERKYLHVDFDLDIKKDGHKIDISANDQNRIYMENHIAYIDNFPIEIEKSKIVINAFMTNKGKYELGVSAKNFNAKDIADIVNSNLIVANGSQMLEPVTDINGTVDFNIKYADNKLNGNITVNEVNLKVKPLLNMPAKITKGEVKIGEKDIDFNNFEGYYNDKTANTLAMKGYTKDYQKTCDTKLDSDIFVTNDFFKNYLSKMLASPVQIVGDSMSKLVIKSINGSVNVLWFFLLPENRGFKFGEQSMVLKDYKTFFKVDLSVIKNILKINTIDYHITKELKRGMTPLVQIKGDLDMANNMKVLDLDINMPRALPSEFLNFLACQNIFKKGTVYGSMHIDNHGKAPTMTGEFSLDKVVIPAQRLFVRSAKLKAGGNKIVLNSEGRFRRENYNFGGIVLNELKLPIIVKNVNLQLDNIDVEKILTQGAGNSDTENAASALVSTGAEDEENSDVIPPFQKGLIVIEKCSLNLLKGVYKDINFSNIHADMTLDKNGLLDLKSNRFDIADGFSSLKVDADLVNRKYHFRLGVKDVNSDTMATSILGLPRQISGKAKGLIDINTDETLKLNGEMKFNVQNGTIGSVGYVEYILKVASLFRNPLAMISPSVLADLVTIPDGRFDDISGEMKLEDNIIKRMNIKSTSPELATFIIGRYNLSTNDAMLRIYTKISDKGKGFAGILRNISLNSLAKTLPTSARNESNYYANELAQIPQLEEGEERAQVFLTKIDGDILNYNFLSSLKRIK